MGNGFTPAYSLSSHGIDPLTALASGARSEPAPAERKQQFVTQLLMQTDTGQSFGAWGNDKYAQTEHYTGAIALAIKPYLNAIRAAKFKCLKRKDTKDGIISKSATAPGHYSRDEEYEPLDPDHPVCRIVERPGGERGKWSLAREMAFLGLQYLLTGDAPAWTPTREDGKPVQFYALVSAQTQLRLRAGQDARYPRGAYAVTPSSGNSIGIGGGLYAGALLPGEEVCRLVDEDPCLRGSGRSRLQVGAAHIDTFEQVVKSRHSFLKSGPMLGGVIVLPGADASVTDLLSKQISTNYGGADNHGKRILILGGGGMADKAAVQQLSMTSEELGFFQTYDQALDFVLALFGSNRVVCNIGETVANKATYIAAKEQFRDGSLVPFFLRCSDFLTQALAEPWADEPGDYRIEMEPPPLGDTEAEENEFEHDYDNDLLTYNEARRKRGLSPVSDGDYPKSVYMAKVTQDVAPPPQPAMPGMPPGAPLDDQGGSGALNGAETQETQGETPLDDPQQPEDTPEAAQNAVASAALKALGVPEESAEGQEGATAPPQKPFGKAITVTKPGAPKSGIYTDKNGRRYKIENGKRVPVGAQAPAKPATGSRLQSGVRPEAAAAQPAASPLPEGMSHDEAAAAIRGSNNFVRMHSPQGPHDIRTGADLKKFFGAGGELEENGQHHTSVKVAHITRQMQAGIPEAAKAVPVATPTARMELRKVDQWAAQHAAKHADRVAQHFGISPERAHALLLDAIKKVAAHAAKSGGKLTGFTLKDRKTGKTARLSPTDKPRAPLGKAMSSLSGPDGGYLVPEGVAVRRKRKRRRAVADILKALDIEG